ncbi:hypothetical protein PAMA_021439 [Pampus argenteus]
MAAATATGCLLSLWAPVLLGTKQQCRAFIDVYSSGITNETGKASMDHDCPDFVPSVFTCSSPKQGQSPRKTKRETLTTETKTQTTPSPNKTLPSFKVPAGIPKLDKMNPVVLLKSVLAPAGGYQCEQCDQNITNVSQLIKHKRQHEEEKSFPCTICGKCFTSQALFMEHQCVITDKTSFPCNMCDRSFTTSHNLKRHKLLHVRDGRKCSKCGILFCQRHNHILYLPQAESINESEQESSISESKNVMLENELPEKLEPSQTADLAVDTQSFLSSQTVAPTTTNPGPLPKSHETPPLASYTRTVSEVPRAQLINPLRSSVPSVLQCSSNPRAQLINPLRSSVPSVLQCSSNPSTSFQFKPPRPPNYPAVFIQPHLPLYPELPPSLQIFSPQYLTSASLEVTRNYAYIFSKKIVLKEKKKKEEEKKKKKEEEKKKKEQAHVKEEQCNIPLTSPDQQDKKERLAYDMEIML